MMNTGLNAPKQHTVVSSFMLPASVRGAEIKLLHAGSRGEEENWLPPHCFHTMCR